MALHLVMISLGLKRQSSGLALLCRLLGLYSEPHHQDQDYLGLAIKGLGSTPADPYRT